MKDTMCGLVKEVNAPSGLVYHTDLPIPEINDDEVLIKVHCSAICGTDLHINRLSVEVGELLMEGHISSLTYTDEPQKGGGFFSKVFR